MNCEDLARNETQATSPRLLMLISLACLHFYLSGTGSFELIIYSHWYREIKLEPGWGWPAVKRCFSLMIHGWHSLGVRASRKNPLQSAVYLLEVKLRVGRKLFALLRRGRSSKLYLLEDFLRVWHRRALSSCSRLMLVWRPSSRGINQHTELWVPLLFRLRSNLGRHFQGVMTTRRFSSIAPWPTCKHFCAQHFFAPRRSSFIHLCFGTKFISLASGNNHHRLLSKLTPLAIPAVGVWISPVLSVWPSVQPQSPTLSEVPVPSKTADHVSGPDNT